MNPHATTATLSDPRATPGPASWFHQRTKPLGTWPAGLGLLWLSLPFWGRVPSAGSMTLGDWGAWLGVGVVLLGGAALLFRRPHRVQLTQWGIQVASRFGRHWRTYSTRVEVQPPRASGRRQSLEAVLFVLLVVCSLKFGGVVQCMFNTLILSMFYAPYARWRDAWSVVVGSGEHTLRLNLYDFPDPQRVAKDLESAECTFF